MAAPNIVNVTSIYGKTMGAALGTSADTDILTCPSDKVLKINSIIVSNVDGTNSADSPIYLEESDQIEAGASATGDLQIIISYEELDDA